MKYISIDPDGTKWYWENNLIHRKDGPAVFHKNGSEAWYLNGKRHRLDGPALDYINTKAWYINGKHIPVNSQKEFEQHLMLIAFI
jgi:hypothetical protein